MSYEQVRDWFSETARRVEAGKEAFSGEEEEAEEEEEEEEATAECAESEGEMEVKEQGEEAKETGEKEDGCEMEEEGQLQGGEDVCQSQPTAEEQTWTAMWATPIPLVLLLECYVLILYKNDTIIKVFISKYYNKIYEKVNL